MRGHGSFWQGTRRHTMAFCLGEQPAISFEYVGVIRTVSVVLAIVSYVYLCSDHIVSYPLPLYTSVYLSSPCCFAWATLQSPT